MESKKAQNYSQQLDEIKIILYCSESTTYLD